MMNLLTFEYIFKRYFIVWFEKWEDLEPDPDTRLKISDPDPDHGNKTSFKQTNSKEITLH